MVSFRLKKIESLIKEELSLIDFEIDDVPESHTNMS